MKKLLALLSKIVVFFLGWAIIGAIVDIPSDDPAIWRFWAEFVPFAVMVAFSFLFWLLEKRKFPVVQWRAPAKNLLVGTLLGCIWIGIPVVVLRLAGVLSFGGKNAVPALWLWAASCLLNVAMQELLVRGYIYQLIKHRYNTAAAIAATTILFTAFHGGAFEEGFIPVLCVLTMSLFMSLAMEYTESLLAPILLHFIWNFSGAVLLNVVRLANDYPHVLNAALDGNRLVTGGNALIEGSVAVLALNSALCIVFALLLASKPPKGKAGIVSG